MAGIDDLLGLGAPGGNVFNIVQGDGSAVPQAPVQQAPQFQHPHGIRNLLGIIGDALLVAHGKDPAYQNGLDQQRQNSALSGFLTNPDQAIQQLMMVNPIAGIKLYQEAHPPSEKTMEQKVYEYEKSLPESERPAFEKSISLTHPGMTAPYTMGPGDTLQMPGSQGSTATMPTVATPDEAAKLPPGTRFRLPDGRIGTVPGGQTPPASGNFR